MGRVFVYEHLTGGGLLDGGDSAACLATLRDEGRALRDALTEDLIQAHWSVDLLDDPRPGTRPPDGATVHAVVDRPTQRALFRKLAGQAEHTVLIAPESEGVLLDYCREAERCGARLRSPASEFVAVTADKHQTIARLSAAGVPVPAGVEVAARARLPHTFPWPALVKPVAGAGSWGIRRIENAAAAAVFPRQAYRMRLETICAGLPASVSLLCGPPVGERPSGRDAAAGQQPVGPGTAVPAGPIQTLPAARQLLAADGSCRYQGGALPLGADLCRRARRLARRALQALPPVTGFVGVDLILGPDDDGSSDVVVEVNPRLTTSYLGLRRLCQNNLAAAMLNAAVGQPLPLVFENHTWQFDVRGQLRPDRSATEAQV